MQTYLSCGYSELLKIQHRSLKRSKCQDDHPLGNLSQRVLYSFSDEYQWSGLVSDVQLLQEPLELLVVHLSKVAKQQPSGIDMDLQDVLYREKIGNQGYFKLRQCSSSLKLILKAFVMQPKRLA